MLGSQRQRETVEDTTHDIQDMANSARGMSDNADTMASLVNDNTAALTELTVSVDSVIQNTE